jgi:hypothetical protein
MHPEGELQLASLQAGWPIRYYEMSSSMIPAIRPGDRIMIVPGSRARLGDIVLSRHGGYLILHRVVARYKGRIITKGDIINRLDESVPTQEIVGRAVHRVRRDRLQSLESFWARFWGLAFSLTIPWIPKSHTMLAALKRLGKEKLGLAMH